MNNKILINSAFVIAIIAIVAAAYVILGGKAKVETPAADSGTYQNAQYGFSFNLPASWKGFSIVSSTWQGNATVAGGQALAQTGPEISIRHPLWTSVTPRQDVPIMIFTLDQWNQLQQDKFHIGAAPVNPSELGRNANYVFALPARYNYAFPAGYEEVDNLIQSKSFKAY